jgi:hypothetical protein
MTAMGSKPPKAALRALVFALLLPLAFTGGLPMLARVIGGPLTDVCHCEVRGGHATCACPICHADSDEFRLTDESIRGKCGDDDVAFGGAIGVAVLAPGFVLAPAPRAGAASVRAPPNLDSAVKPEPPTPPPRLAAV